MFNFDLEIFLYAIPVPYYINPGMERPICSLYIMFKMCYI